MELSSTPTRSADHTRPRRVGCVSYLNAKPLIEGLDDLPDPRVRFDVPSRLLSDLQTGEVDIALCPVIDYFRSAQPLEVVPVGGIGCRGPTLTVRLFSQVPLDAITTVHADIDSHTSIALLRILLAERLELHPRLVAYDAREQFAKDPARTDPQAVLLIGDKVVTRSPSPRTYPHQVDLGESWLALTGLPFVFAIWMTRAGTSLGSLPALLESQRLANAQRIPQIVARYAGPHGWPKPLAQEYLGHLLRYAIGPEELHAMEHFGILAHRRGLIDELRPLKIWAGGPQGSKSKAQGTRSKTAEHVGIPRDAIKADKTPG